MSDMLLNNKDPFPKLGEEIVDPFVL